MKRSGNIVVDRTERDAYRQILKQGPGDRQTKGEVNKAALTLTLL